MTEQLRIGWVGFHREGFLALSELVEAGHKVAAIITLEDDLLSKRSGAVDFGHFAERHAIPLYKVRNINDLQSIELLRSLRLDILFVIGWSQILQAEALATPRIGAIGAHASLLPGYRGSAPVNWAIINGERQTGNSLIWLAEAVDAGDIAAQEAIVITPYDDCSSIYEEVARTNARMIPEFVGRVIKGQEPRERQQIDHDRVLPRRRPEHGAIDWRWPAATVYDFIRALTRPYPGAFGFIDGEKYVIWRAALPPYEPTGHFAGTVIGPVVSTTKEACGLLVACGQGAIILLEAETENGSLLEGRELLESKLAGRMWDECDNELSSG